jgi:hypothetical protein
MRLARHLQLNQKTRDTSYEQLRAQFPTDIRLLPHHAGIGRRKFISATAVAEAALALPLAAGQDLNKVAQTQS